MIPETTTHAVPPAGITNTTMLQLEDDGALGGFAPYCSSSGWCGRPWGTPKDKEPEPRVGSYVAGEWQIPGSVPNYSPDSPDENPRIPETTVSACSVAGLDNKNTIRCTA